MFTTEWGGYVIIEDCNRHRVKKLTINPGCTISMQYHHHRAEHWIVVRGTASITVGDTTMLVSENQSAFAPGLMPHQIHNPGVIILEIIEIRTGSYLNEDDIVRIEM